MARCPKCKSTSNHRMKRKGIIKLIPGTKKYACDHCNAEYVWFSFLGISLRI